MVTTYFLLSALAAGSLAAPLNSCSTQRDCLSWSIGECTNEGERVVCLDWGNRPECTKDTAESVSHYCPVPGIGVESWPAFDVICQTVSGGGTATFGVKDGNGCAADIADPFQESGGTVTCTNEQVCNNNQECKWEIVVPSCGSPPSPSVTPAPESPAPDTPAPDTPAPDTPAPDTPAPDTPAPDTPAPDTPAPDTPAPDTPAPDTPTPTTPGTPETPEPEPTPEPATPSPGYKCRFR